jgi:type I restriction enzyme M protein
LGAHQFIIDHNPSLDKDQKQHLKLHALRGVDIVDGVTRVATMNLLLHGVGPTGNEAEPPVKTDDSLRSDPSDRFDLVLTNPPFGKKSSVWSSTTMANSSARRSRSSATISGFFWSCTSNKPLSLPPPRPLIPP